MPRGRPRLFVVLCATLLLGSCDKKSPFAPDDDPSLAVSPGDPVELTSTPISHAQINLAWVHMSARETGFEVHRSTTGELGPFRAHSETGPNVFSFSDVLLTAATEYCYMVRSFRTTGQRKTYSGFSNTKCAKTLEYPAPSGTNARPVGLNQSVEITWTDNSSDEEGFRVERSPTPDGPWAVVARSWEPPSLPPNSVSRIDYDRPREEQLCYRVIAFKIPSEAASNVDCTHLPASATELKATAVADPAVDLSWKDNSAHEDGYDIERSDTGGWPFTTVGSVGPNTTAFRDVTMSADKTYWYRVWVTREGVRTGVTNTATVIIISSPPSAPSDLSATPTPSGATDTDGILDVSTITLIWADNSANEEGFRVERSENGGASWISLGSTTDRRFSDADRVAEQQVCYRAIAFNSAGEGPPSNVDCTTPPAKPTTLVAKTASGFAIELTWTDNSNAEDGYEVRRRFEECYYGYYGYYCYQDYTPIATLGPNETSYLDRDLGPNVYHSYLVVARKDGGSSNPSIEAGAWSDFAPIAPSNLTASVVSSTQIDLGWSDNSTDEEHFVVVRCTGVDCGDGGFTHEFWVGANVTEYSDKNLQPNTAYTYRVYSLRGRTSDPSNNVSRTTLP